MKKVQWLFLLPALLIAYRQQEKSDDRLIIAASIAPLADFCRQVGGERVSVFTVVPSGANPHTFELDPQLLIRMGDLFGEPVNIAARLASNAREGTTLVDQNLADALADDEDVRVRHVPALSVRGYRRLRASALVRAHRTGETR